MDSEAEKKSIGDEKRPLTTDPGQSNEGEKPAGLGDLWVYNLLAFYNSTQLTA